MERQHDTYLSYKSLLLWAEVEQEDQQEAVASLTVVKKEKKVICVMDACYQSICLVNSAFSAGQKMLLVPHMKIFQKSIMLYNSTKRCQDASVLLTFANSFAWVK